MHRLLILAAALAGAPESGRAEEIRIDSALVTLIEQVEVPARETGVLASVAVREGELVEKGDVLARIDDTEARLLRERAEIDRDIARDEAGNDVKIRFSRKAWGVAKAEVKRAQDAIGRYPGAVSATELDRLRLSADKSELEIEQAERDLASAQLVLRARENELALAEHHVDRCRIVAPLSGVVVQINRRPGEWVEPAQPVVRILRINRLRVEGFLSADAATGNLADAPVTFTVDLPERPAVSFPGTLVFVSPEIDPVNGQVRVWAEIENRDLLLRPGKAGVLNQSEAEKPGGNRYAADQQHCHGHSH
jgi:RND family efflux transporter MFP subunit